MPTKKKSDKASAGVFPKLPKEVLDLLPTGVMTAGQIEEMAGALKKALIERALGAELSRHLGLVPWRQIRSGRVANRCQGL